VIICPLMQGDGVAAAVWTVQVPVIFGFGQIAEFRPVEQQQDYFSVK